VGYGQPDTRAVTQYAAEAGAVSEGSGEVLSPEVESLIDEHKRAKRLLESAEYHKELALTKRMGEQAAQAEEEKLRHVRGLKASQIMIRRTRWLWRDRVPLGGLALLAGKGDTSKSTLFACFTAWLTTGQMKGEFYGEPKKVLYVVNEDSIAETVVPRMIAHGANLDMVEFLNIHSPLGSDALSLPRDGELLREYIRDTDAVATFIDPLSANVTGRANDSRDTRNTYQEVNNIAEETMTTIWGLAHTRKAGAADIMEAIIGSSEQGNVARSVHGLVMDPEEDGARILSCEKLNVGQKHMLAGLRFVVEPFEVRISQYESTSMPRIKWIEETEDTASGVLEDAMFGNTGVDECARWLLELLYQNGGELSAEEVREKAGKRFSPAMIKRGRAKAKVITKRTRETPSRSIWYHPDAQPSIHTQG
jgi:AAA domain